VPRRKAAVALLPQPKGKRMPVAGRSPPRNTNGRGRAGEPSPSASTTRRREYGAESLARPPPAHWSMVQVCRRAGGGFCREFRPRGREARPAPGNARVPVVDFDQEARAAPADNCAVCQGDLHGPPVPASETYNDKVVYQFSR
jgi:hypothetical protein